ncbi:MAG: ABC transporter permease [Gammaproteobacteria bacterium]|nr:ABC transporter permease [Gammaproteobacteria bacterium]
MSASIQTIPIPNLILMVVPVLIVIGYMFKWSLNGWNAVYAVARMLLQLVLIGYILVYIFEAEHSLVVVAVLCVMFFISGSIALHPIKNRHRHLYLHITLSLSVGCLFMLALVTQWVLALKPWFLPQFMIPIAGMIFANAMNAVSLSAERFSSETGNGVAYEIARQRSLQVALIPLLNSLFAVGLVSLPGMMTGQILSGVSPLIAVRYQIMVMCMVFGSAGISVICYLLLAKTRIFNTTTGSKMS